MRPRLPWLACVAIAGISAAPRWAAAQSPSPAPASASPAPSPAPTAPSAAPAVPASSSPAPAAEPASNPRSPEPEDDSSSSPPPTTDEQTAGASHQAEGSTLDFGIPGEFQARAIALSTLPLQTTPGYTTPNTLGQNFYIEQWFRLSPHVDLGNVLHLITQFDIVRGILLGDSTAQVSLSQDNRDTTLSPFPHGPIDVRWVYLEWNSPIGLFRVGQQGSHWGLGIVANDGNHAPLFGDYRMGDIVERVVFATRPGGRSSNVVAAIGGDLVYRDRLASLLTYQVPAYDGGTNITLGGDWAWQGLVSVFYQEHTCVVECERKRVGTYIVYRDQTNAVGNWLRVAVADLYGRWEWPTPDGRARVFAAGELVGIFGATTMAPNPQFAQQTVIQFGGATELGLERDHRYRITLAAGYASGDSNPFDGTQRQFTFNPDYHVGLIMFPEMVAWETARSASIAIDRRIMGLPTPGAVFLPTSGGVSNAMYFNPTAIVNFSRWLDVRAGMVVGVSTTDVVDPVRYTLYGGPQNYYGGDSHARDLGIEFDGGLMGHIPLTPGLLLTGGAQGGVMLPGHAFDDASGHGPGTQWLVRGMLGLTYD